MSGYPYSFCPMDKPEHGWKLLCPLGEPETWLESLLSAERAKYMAGTAKKLASATKLNPCHPDRGRATLSEAKGSKGEWKDPGAVSFAMPHQGVFTRHCASESRAHRAPHLFADHRSARFCLAILLHTSGPTIDSSLTITSAEIVLFYKVVQLKDSKKIGE